MKLFWFAVIGAVVGFWLCWIVKPVTKPQYVITRPEHHLLFVVQDAFANDDTTKTIADVRHDMVGFLAGDVAGAKLFSDYPRDKKSKQLLDDVDDMTLKLGIPQELVGIDSTMDCYTGPDPVAGADTLETP